MSRRRFLGTGAAMLAVPPAWAQPATKLPGFPGRPLELLVAYPAGGGMDITARILAKHLEPAAGNPVLVVNRAGAAGLVGHTWLATQAAPDGHVLGVLASNFWQDSFFRSEGRWSYRDIVPIAFLNYDPVTWIVSSKGPFAQAGLTDVVEAARKNPGGIKVAASTATSTAFTLDQVARYSAVEFLPVAYQGGRQALTDLLGGHIDVSYGYLGEYRSQLDAGEVRVLAVTSAQRIPALPDVPTFNEVLGQDDVLWDAFRFVGAPAKTPQARLQWLGEALRQAIATPELAQEYVRLGATPDATLNEPGRLAEEFERRASRERDFFVKTGRLQPA
ncbi:tripartite tricarboxylate transporter substrate binding protein [Verticiella sediminum]|uniref:tripartite tricarboxylate transporter substrate binding protein n=1 Tax=Verticiella sediminum TaxID=1247510 RepID=UPI00147913F7|nr:tripartite tricarboxylate transporter substrate binding protein [Verticiella sediminum]